MKHLHYRTVAYGVKPKPQKSKLNELTAMIPKL
jgi:hypothetical protein